MGDLWSVGVRVRVSDIVWGLVGFFSSFRG